MRKDVADAAAEAAVRGDGEEAIAPTYVVECYWPGIAEDQVRDALARFARVPQGTALHGDFARCIGCILVPSDGLALFLFEGLSAAIVQSRSTWAEIPFDRIVEAVQIEAADRLG